MSPNIGPWPTGRNADDMGMPPSPPPPSSSPRTPDDTTQQRLAAIRERLEKATPGPWTIWDDCSSEVTIRASGKVISGVVASVRLAWAGTDQRDEQAANVWLIANATIDLRFLLDLVDSLQRQGEPAPESCEPEYRGADIDPRDLEGDRP